MCIVCVFEFRVFKPIGSVFSRQVFQFKHPGALRARGIGRALQHGAVVGGHAVRTDAEQLLFELVVGRVRVDTRRPIPAIILLARLQPAVAAARHRRLARRQVERQPRRRSFV